MTTTCGRKLASSSKWTGTLGCRESGKLSRSAYARAESSSKCGSTGRGLSMAAIVVADAR